MAGVEGGLGCEGEEVAVEEGEVADWGLFPVVSEILSKYRRGMKC